MVVVDSISSLCYEMSDTWTSWAPVWGGDLTEMVDCKSYWIDMNVADTLTVEGHSGLLFPLSSMWVRGGNRALFAGQPFAQFKRIRQRGRVLLDLVPLVNTPD